MNQITFQHTTKSGITVNITATVCDGMVADYSATTLVSRNGVMREVFVAERGSRMDTEVCPLILSRMTVTEVCDDDDDDDFSPEME